MKYRYARYAGSLVYEPYGDADEVVAALEEIRNREALTPDAVLQHAQQGRSPLHHCVEWNKEVAAHRYRKHQVAALMSRCG